jgi:hypothetical protein
MRFALSAPAAPVAAAAAARRAAASARAPSRGISAAATRRSAARRAPPRAAAGSERSAGAASASPDTLAGNPLRPTETVAEMSRRRAVETDAVAARIKARPARARHRCAPHTPQRPRSREQLPCAAAVRPP